MVKLSIKVVFVFLLHLHLCCMQLVLLDGNDSCGICRGSTVVYQCTTVGSMTTTSYRITRPTSMICTLTILNSRFIGSSDECQDNLAIAYAERVEGDKYVSNISVTVPDGTSSIFVECLSDDTVIGNRTLNIIANDGFSFPGEVRTLNSSEEQRCIFNWSSDCVVDGYTPIPTCSNHSRDGNSVVCSDVKPGVKYSLTVQAAMCNFTSLESNQVVCAIEDRKMSSSSFGIAVRVAVGVLVPLFVIITAAVVIIIIVILYYKRNICTSKQKPPPREYELADGQQGPPVAPNLNNSQLPLVEHSLDEPPPVDHPPDRPPIGGRPPAQPPIGSDRPPVEGHPLDKPPFGGHPSDQPPIGSDRPPVEGHPLDKPPFGGHPSDQPPVEGHPPDQPPIEGHPLDKPPVGGHPPDQPPVEGHPPDQPPIDPPDQPPVEGHPSDQPSVGGHPLDKTSTESNLLLVDEAMLKRIVSDSTRELVLLAKQKAYEEKNKELEEERREKLLLSVKLEEEQKRSALLEEALQFKNEQLKDRDAALEYLKSQMRERDQKIKKLEKEVVELQQDMNRFSYFMNNMQDTQKQITKPLPADSPSHTSQIPTVPETKVDKQHTELKFGQEISRQQDIKNIPEYKNYNPTTTTDDNVQYGHSISEDSNNTSWYDTATSDTTLCN